MPHTPSSEWTPLADREILERIYARHPDKLPHVDAAGFVRQIAWRIYTEFCCNRNESRWQEHIDYDGKAYRTWVDQETHLALEGAPVDDERYKRMRENIMRAVVERAMELFKAWGSSAPHDQNDKRNLRASLRPYLARQSDER